MATQGDASELLVVAFQDVNKAQEVLKVLQQLDHEHAVNLKNAAIVQRDASGKVSVHETRDFNAKQGAVAGALAGGLLGMMRGNLLAGAALGAASGLGAAKLIDLGFSDSYLKEVAEQLTPGSSAIVAVVDFTQVDRAMSVLDQFDGGRILRQTLPGDLGEKLSAVIED